MARKEDRRNARRIRLDPPVAADLSYMPVSVLDLSTSGARIRHDSPLTFQPGKRFVLTFRCDGEEFRLPCTIARSRLEMQNSAQRKVYSSGVHFTDVDADTSERLWGLIAVLAIDVLARQADNNPAERYEFTILTH